MVCFGEMLPRELVGWGLAQRPVEALQAHDAGGLVWLLAIGNEANRTDAKYLLEVRENVSMMGQLGAGERKGESRVVQVV